MLPSNPKPYLLQLIFITLLLHQLNQVNSTTLLDFSFPDFFSYPYKNGTKLTFLGNATLANNIGALQLTQTDGDGKPIKHDAGQVSYSDPVFLWDRSGHRASFHTSFSFFLKNHNDPEKKTADGFAFFLAATNSTVEDAGGCLGLFRVQSAADPKKNQVVAVEFDTWRNKDWNDPDWPHIGINVNSTISVKTLQWQNDDAYRNKTGTVHITYDAKSRNLSVRLSYVNGREYNLSKVVDLTEALPMWVRVGFSAATGLRDAETPYILSWSFTSTLVSKRIRAMNQNLGSVTSY